MYEFYDRIKSDNVKNWFKDKKEFFIVQHPSLYHYCAYVVFEHIPVKERSFRGLISYVPVHGGVTFADQMENSKMIYGFDCAHLDDDFNPNLKNIDWLTKEIENMAFAIEVAAAYEDEYLSAVGNEGKANIITRYHQNLIDDGIIFDISDNFGAMLNVLFGDL